MARMLLRVPAGYCAVLADSDKLTRMSPNLVYNAVSFTPPDGEIVLSLTWDDEYAYLTVRDTGSGIASGVLPKLFDRFFTTREKEGGTGMRLYIVRTIAREHGGDVQVQSQPGRGAKFTVWLSLSDQKAF